MKNTKTITFNGKKETVTKIPLKRFGELAMALDGIQEVFIVDGQPLDINNETILEKAPYLLTQLTDTTIKFLSAATGFDKEVLEEAGLDDALSLIEAVLEINNIDLIIDKVKNLRKALVRK
ncbi:hypothetical protein [Jeotgalibacillus malaysiensis]|uniref:hypothetical protein n=1 Tax=Jeotgalibacillus malaysiensis TaxID=1508404 RepID=UPI00384D2C97